MDIYEVHPESINKLHIEAVRVMHALPVRVSHLLSVKGITCIAYYDVITFSPHFAVVLNDKHRFGNPAACDVQSSI